MQRPDSAVGFVLHEAHEPNPGSAGIPSFSHENPAERHYADGGLKSTSQSTCLVGVSQILNFSRVADGQ